MTQTINIGDAFMATSRYEGAWPTQGSTPIEDIKEAFRAFGGRHDPEAAKAAALDFLAAECAEKMRADEERVDSRVDALFRAFGLVPPKRNRIVIHKARQCGSGASDRNLAEVIADLDAQLAPQPRASGLVATWVVGRFGAPPPPTPRSRHSPSRCRSDHH